MKPARLPEASPESRRLDEDAALELLDQVIASEGRFSLELCERLRAACQEYAAGDGTRSLEACFGWQTRPGERSIATRLAEARRLTAFADAWRAMTDCEGLSDWRRCEILATQLEEFESTYLPTWKDAGPPAGVSRLRRALYQAFTALERPPPRTAKGLHELLTRARVLT
jgi:hypothetical protein